MKVINISKINIMNISLNIQQKLFVIYTDL